MMTLREQKNSAATLIRILSLMLALLILAGCGSQVVTESVEETDMILEINGEAADVTWEDNEATAALKENLPIDIDMSMYGGFEQVGPIGFSVPADDKNLTTEPGDIVLYSGDQIVVFYGSNTWAYTKLGKINMPIKELERLLGNGDVSLTLR